jgi:hypothetical protein
VRCRVRAVLLLAAAVAAVSPASAGPTVNELVEVADIASLSPSPSGRTVAFRVERPSIERNSYAIDWYVADLDTGTTRRVGGGGAPIYGDAGPLEPGTALWSPDERFLFHRALMDDAIGVWRTAADGSGSRLVVVRDADVERLEGTPDGRFLTYVLGPSRDEIARAERREYDEGILVDASVDLAQGLFRGGSVNGRMASQRLVGRWYGRAGLLWRAPRHRYRLDLSSLESGTPEPVAPPTVAPLTPTAGTTLSLEAPGRPPVRVVRADTRSRLEVERRSGTARCAAEACGGEQRIVAVTWRPRATSFCSRPRTPTSARPFTCGT